LVGASIAVALTGARALYLIEKHFRYTGSFRAKEVLHDWTNKRTRFVKVFPHEYRRALRQLYEARPVAEREKLAMGAMGAGQTA